MKKNPFILILLFAIIFVTQTLLAQEEENIVVVTTWYVENPDGGSPAEFDSLASILSEKVISKNSYIIDQSLVRHYWGSDSRQRVIITEYANMEDIDKADKESDKLFMEAFPKKEDRQAFNKAFGKYWRGHHSDEIYSIVTKK